MPKEMGPKPSSRLSRKERRVLTRKAAKQQSRRIDRKIIGGVAGVLSASSILGGIILNQGRQDQRSPSPETPVLAGQRQAEMTYQSAEQIIRGEISRLGIAPSASEQARWQEHGFGHLAQRIEINETTSQEARRRVNVTLNLMRQSENPYLKDAHDHMRSLVDRGELLINLYRTTKDQDGREGIMVTSLKTADNKLQWYIDVSIDQILNKMDIIELALSFVHEDKHIKNMINFQDSLNPAFSAEERASREKERMRNRELVIAEEADGNGYEAQAYIYQMALGYPMKWDTSMEEAAMFIKSGNDVASSTWKDYVTRQILQMKPY